MQSREELHPARREESPQAARAVWRQAPSPPVPPLRAGPTSPEREGSEGQIKTKGAV